MGKKSGLKKKEREHILDVIDNEGFDYTFGFYSTFDNIKDPEFHRLRSNYMEASNALRKYLKLDY